MKNSTGIMKYESQVVKSNHAFQLILPNIYFKNTFFNRTPPATVSDI